MTNRPEVYLCLCVRHFFVQTYLRFHSETRNKPLAIVDANLPAQPIVDLNDAAAARGFCIGMTAVEASLDPELTVATRAPLDEKTNKHDLIQACHTISPLVEDCSSYNECILMLDVTASFAIFENLDKLIDALLRLLRPMKLDPRIVVSSNFHTSRLLVQATHLPSPYLYVPISQERISLSALNVDCLELDPCQVETFENWGLRTLNDLASLPLDEFATRLGPSAKRLYELAHGRCGHMFQPLAIAELLMEKVTFDSPIDFFESLLFSVAPLLDKLLLRAQDHLQSISAITLSLVLSNRSTHTRDIRPALPSTSNKLFLKLIHLDLEAHPPSSGVVEMTLTAILGKSKKAQLSMFSPQHPDISLLDVTLARLRKIVGRDNVGSPVLEDTHLQSTFVVNSFRADSASSSGEVAAERPLAAMRLAMSNNNIHVRVTNGIPIVFTLGNRSYKVNRAYGPWKSTGQWWSDAYWNLEHWDITAVTLETQTHLHCCLSLNKENNRWALDGLYD